MDGIHERNPYLNCRVNLVIIIGPYMNVIARMDSHTARMGFVIFLCVNCLFKGSCFCMQQKSLTPHKTEDCT